MDQAARSMSKAKLLSKDMEAEKKSRGKYFEARESAKAAAQYRSLEPGRWDAVVADVGGMRKALEEIRRRVWTPLCAPTALLDELGAERLKGVLLYGPPGCGKSYLAKRLAKSLSRRPATVVSGPEIIDKYVGSSERNSGIYSRPHRSYRRARATPRTSRRSPKIMSYMLSC